MTNTPITIVGAGIAGLTAAYTLQNAGLTPRILEASSRIGGRVDSLYSAQGEVIADLGPTWIWPPFQPIIARWLERLHLPTFDQYDQGDAVLDGFAPTPRRQPVPGQYGMARIVGGPQQLISALVKNLPDGSIQTNTPVDAIHELDNGKLAVHTDTTTLTTERVLLATPLRLTAERLNLPDTLKPGVTAALRAMPTWMAAQARAVMTYDEPFWRHQGLSGRIASRQGPLFECHDHTSAQGQASLFGFVATAPEHRDPEPLEQAILAQLERCLGPKAAQPIELRVRDWAKEPWICATADRTGPPEHPAVGPDLLRSGHLNNRLWFCGAESADQSPGLIEGALAAGEQAAEAAIAEHKRTRL